MENNTSCHRVWIVGWRYWLCLLKRISMRVVLRLVFIQTLFSDYWSLCFRELASVAAHGIYDLHWR